MDIHNLATIEAWEQINTDLESLRVSEFFDACLTKFKTKNST